MCVSVNGLSVMHLFNYQTFFSAAAETVVYISFFIIKVIYVFFYSLSYHQRPSQLWFAFCIRKILENVSVVIP